MFTKSPRRSRKGNHSLTSSDFKLKTKKFKTRAGAEKHANKNGGSVYRQPPYTNSSGWVVTKTVNVRKKNTSEN